MNSCIHCSRRVSGTITRVAQERKTYFFSRAKEGGGSREEGCLTGGKRKRKKKGKGKVTNLGSYESALLRGRSFSFLSSNVQLIADRHIILVARLLVEEDERGGQEGDEFLQFSGDPQLIHVRSARTLHNVTRQLLQRVHLVARR